MSSSNLSGTSVAVPTNSTYQNGSYQNSIDVRRSAKMPSGLADPHVKNFGRKTMLSLDLRQKSSWNNDDDDIGESWAPGSGIVNKLKNKFSSLNVREVPIASSNMKMALSLEDLSVPVKRKEGALLSPTEVPISKPLTKSSKSHAWARSVDCLQPSRKISLQNNFAASENSKKAPVVNSFPKSSRDIGINAAPDVDLARDDIVIIETTPSVQAKKNEDAEFVAPVESRTPAPRPLSYREEIVDELPKQNTVINIRSIFEAATAISQKNVYKRQRPQPLKAVHRSNSKDTVNVVSPTTNGESNDTVSSSITRCSDTLISAGISSNNDTSPLFSPRSEDVLSPVSSSFQDKKIDTVSVGDEFKQKIPSSNNVSPTSQIPSSPINTSFEDVKPTRPLRPMPVSNSKSTASVKPTVASKPKSPTRPARSPPVIHPAPASAAISYKSSSPVVPVAPFKDQQSDRKDDGSPVMIFDKSKIKAKKKSQRTKDYTPIDNEISKTEKISDGKKITVTNISIGKIPLAKNKDIGDENVENLKSSTSPSNNRNVIRNEKKSRAPPPPVAAKTQTTNIDEIILERVPKPTPVPVAARRSPKVETSEAKSRGSMIYISSSSETSGSDFTPPETPRRTEQQTAKSKPSATIDTSIAQSAARQSLQAATISKLPDNISVTSPPPPIPTSKQPVPINKPYELNTEPQPVKGIPSIISKSQSRDSSSDTQTSKSDQTESAPIKGIPSIIAKRLQAQSEKKDPSQVAVNSVKSSPLRNQFTSDDSSTDSDTFSPRHNLRSTAAQQSNDKDDISNSILNEMAAVRKKLEDKKAAKAGGGTMIFDSSQLAKKRKENQRQRQTFAAGAAVPSLDLSGLDDDKKTAPVASRPIKPCNIEVIGGNCKTSRSCLDKKRKVKISIKFNEAAMIETFEYLREDCALQEYLDEHPNDTQDILFLDGGGESEMGESSDDTTDEMMTPRGGDDDTLRSNPALGSAGSFQSYRGRFTDEFVFGSSMAEPEVKVARLEPEEPEDMHLRPADNVDTWSTNDSSDLLF